MAKNFSDKYLANLKPKEKPFTVREAKGFTLKILPSGTKTFLYIYEQGGKRKQINLGVYPYVTLNEARRKYNQLSEQAARGELISLPVKEEEKSAPEILTVGKLITKYVEVSREAHSQEWAYIKEKNLHRGFAGYEDRSADSFSKREAIELIQKAGLGGPGAAKNFHKIARAMYEFAIDMEFITSSPFERVRKLVPALKVTNRDRFLSEKEIQVLWEAIAKSGMRNMTQRALKLVLVTAQRPGEVVGMHRREINGDWWTIPAERAEKGGRAHRVFLTGTAKELIGTEEGFIFPSVGKVPHLKRMALSFAVWKEKCFGLPRWTPHDLRRTARTHMSRLKIPKDHAEAVLNHAKEGMVKIYDQYELDEEKKEALQLWEAELLRLVAHSNNSE